MWKGVLGRGARVSGGMDTGVWGGLGSILRVQRGKVLGERVELNVQGFVSLVKGFEPMLGEGQRVCTHRQDTS